MDTQDRIEFTPVLAPKRRLFPQATAASIAMAVTLPALAADRKEAALKAEAMAIRPFQIHVPEADLADKGVSIPVAVSAFPDELYQAARSWVERAYPKLVYYKKHSKGGHFAAWENPDLLSEDIRAGFRSLRDVPVTALNR